MQKSAKVHLTKITVTAMCIALATVCRMFLEFMIPVGGANTLRVSVEGIFLTLPAMLFGPVYGGVSSGLMDIIGSILKPAGAYNLLITLAAALLGVLRGLFWKLFEKRSHIFATVFGVVLFGLFFGFGAVNSFAGFLSINGKDWAVTVVPLFIGLLGFVGLVVNYFVKNYRDLFLKIFLTQFIAGGAVSIINSIILYTMYMAGSNLGFMLFAAIRLIEETAFSVLSAFALAVLYPACRRALSGGLGLFKDTAEPDKATN